VTGTALPLCLNAFNGSPFLGPREDLPGWIDAAAEAGFPLISPDRFALEAWLARGETLAGLATKFGEAGIGCGAITAVGLLDGADMSTDLRWAADAADALGASFLQVNVGASDRESRRRAVERACEAIDGRGLRLAIEYLPFAPLNTVAETVEIARNVGFDRAGAMIDIWHHNFGPDVWADLAAVPLDAIAYIELDDAPSLETDDLAAETLSRRVFPGEGTFDIERFLGLFRAKGYTGMVSVEILNEAWRTRSPHDQADAAYGSSAPYLR
jgi:sugar phosphate isomerase/epimerase